ncbi:hypothetical protein Tsp_09843 [Trichinella spiralis]|uniref:Uncharacterized protein n=1 Tax=Trichinella spiralis TaxID=6334 RepID=E5SXI4_TRISP|nr:hypothetical protein Tsp_09843 [Trichinella spiralis]KRY41670.1 hypothetical protein T01_2950 [Trichinella spiralis]
MNILKNNTYGNVKYNRENRLLTGNLQQFPAVVAQSVHLGPKMALFYSRTRKTAGFWAHGRGFSRRLIACCALVAGKFEDFEMLSERSIAVPLLNHQAHGKGWQNISSTPHAEGQITRYNRRQKLAVLVAGNS